MNNNTENEFPSFLPEGYNPKRKKGGRHKKVDFRLYPESCDNQEPEKECITCGDKTFQCDCVCKGLNLFHFRKIC